mmetsp:Transcript_16752/g.34337  ORF Transcript_16752/g.34337 Transcript_16752/m.34337 type:complete len:583 (-) Transcript_16752:589-2337(-)
MADADEATNALIAKLLAEDDQYEDMYGLAPDSDSDDWGTSRKRKKKKSGAKVGRPPKAPRERKYVTKEDDPNQEYTASGRRKRKDAGKAMRKKPRAWTEDEERLFREALKLYGRDWKKCAAHVGTRDAKAFTSHAQKYFIKLCLQGKPLPRAVAKSGEGYTLSGKPLDPNSAAARAYGFKPDSLEKLKAQGLANEVEGGLQCQRVTEEGEDKEEDELPISVNKENEGDTNNNINNNAGAAVNGDGAAKEGKRVPRPKKRKPKEEVVLAPIEPTEYAKSRPKRERAGQHGARSNFVSYMSGSLSLIPCQEFTGVIGAVGTQAQPFSVDISDEAMLLMDFHAHLSCFEVIGYLGGDWNPEARKLCIRRAFPCKGLEGTQQTDSCEMDPAAELAAKDKMDEWGLQVVGWYHSHPTFKPNPSMKDIENQENYQALFHDAETKTEPFVGMIFSPYDLRLPGKASRSETFWVQKGGRQGAEPTPMHVRSARRPIEALPSADTKQAMKDLLGEGGMAAGGALGRIQLTELWRPFTNIVDGKTPQGGPCTKLAKMRGALQHYLPDTDESDDFLDEIFTEIQTKWGTDLGY